MKFKANEDLQIGEITVKAGQEVELSADSQTAIDLVGAQKLSPVETQNTGAGVLRRDDLPPLHPPQRPQRQDDGGDEKVVVTRSQLKDLAKEITEQVRAESAGEINKLREDYGMLLEISDKKQLTNWMSRHRKDAGTFLRLSTKVGEDGKNKIVVGWRTLEDKVYKDVGSGRWHEKQLMRIKYQDDTEEDMDYERFTELIRTNQLTAKVLERTEVQTSDPAVKKYRFKVKVETTGEELEIMDSFVN